MFKTIDGTGEFIIDSHVHMTEVQGIRPLHIKQNIELFKEIQKQIPKSYLYFGPTTLINLGGISEEQLESFNNKPLKPDLYYTGKSGVSVANRYPINFSPEQYRYENSPIVCIVNLTIFQPY